MKKVLFILAGFFLLIHFFSYSQQQSPFKIVSGIPYLPVYQNTGSVSSPVNGMFIFSLDDATPMIYNGSSWSDICSVSLTTTTENYFVIKSGIPCIPAKITVSGTPGTGDMYYSTTDNAVMVYNGASWEKLRTIGRINFSNNSGVSTDNTLKIVQVPVLASAPGGISVGAIYINSTSNNFNYYTSSGWASLSCPMICGDELVFTHTYGDGCTPETVTITYNTKSSNLSGSTKCWITQNLGAASQATASDDASVTSRGWFWQFNQKQGHYNKGLEGTQVNYPTMALIAPPTTNWTSANDPCTQLFGATSGWRIPTNAEWTYVDGASGGNWSSAANAYDSDLKLHMPGYILLNLSGTMQAITDIGKRGLYCSSTRYDTSYPYYLHITSSSSVTNRITYYHSIGFTLRCLKD